MTKDTGLPKQKNEFIPIVSPLFIVFIAFSIEITFDIYPLSKKVPLIKRNLLFVNFLVLHH